MTFSIEIPDHIAEQLALDGPDPQRRALEMFALEGYREKRLSAGSVGKLLGYGFHQTEAFLKENGADLHYDMQDFESDMKTLRELLGK
jgi:predicted HTH domain antitoxin